MGCWAGRARSLGPNRPSPAAMADMLIHPGLPSRGVSSPIGLLGMFSWAGHVPSLASASPSNGSLACSKGLGFAFLVFPRLTCSLASKAREQQWFPPLGLGLPCKADSAKAG